MKVFKWILRILFLALFTVLMFVGKFPVWLALFGVSLLAAILFGRLYCGYACPMNTLMIPAEWLSKKLKIQTDKTPRWLRSGIMSWVFLGASLLAMLLLKRVAGIDLPILPIWVALSVLVTLRYKPEVFHNLICPFGPLQRLFGRYARFSERVEPAACVGCKLCEKVCPSAAVVVQADTHKAVIDPSLCHQCTNCVDVCPQDAIGYSMKK